MSPTLNLLRLLASGLLVFATMTIVGVGLLTWIPGISPVIGGLAALGSGLAMGGLALRFLNPKGTHILGLKTREEHVAELDSADLLLTTHFTATQAFQVEELEDEGSHYFIKLNDHSVLFLSGQYLYEYEPDFTESRVFPNSEFSVRRHKLDEYVADIQVSGRPIEPELKFPAFTAEDYRQSAIPEDGEIIRDRSYEDLKREFASRTQNE